MDTGDIHRQASNYTVLPVDAATGSATLKRGARWTTGDVAVSSTLPPLFLHKFFHTVYNAQDHDRARALMRLVSSVIWL